MIAPKSNSFANSEVKGGVGYDNPRDNIDPHVKTSVLTTIEGTIQDPPVNAEDIVNKQYVDSEIITLSAGTLWKVSGANLAMKTARPLDMINQKIINLLNPTLDQDAATKKYVDDLPLTTPAGSNTQVQFNDNLVFGGDAGFTYNKTTDVVTVSGGVWTPHGQTQPARALNTTYQNTTGHPIIVSGTCLCKWDDLESIGYFEAKTDSATPPTTIRQRGGTVTINSLTGMASHEVEQYFAWSMTVANNHYYRVDSTTNGGVGAVTLMDWNEVDF